MHFITFTDINFRKCSLSRALMCEGPSDAGSATDVLSHTRAKSPGVWWNNHSEPFLLREWTIRPSFFFFRSLLHSHLSPHTLSRLNIYTHGGLRPRRTPFLGTPPNISPHPNPPHTHTQTQACILLGSPTHTHTLDAVTQLHKHSAFRLSFPVNETNTLIKAGASATDCVVPAPSPGLRCGEHVAHKPMPNRLHYTQHVTALSPHLRPQLFLHVTNEELHRTFYLQLLREPREKKKNRESVSEYCVCVWEVRKLVCSKRGIEWGRDGVLPRVWERTPFPGWWSSFWRCSSSAPWRTGDSAACSPCSPSTSEGAEIIREESPLRDSHTKAFISHSSSFAQNVYSTDHFH